MKTILKQNYLRTGLAFATIGLCLAGCTKQLDQMTQTSVTDPVFWKTEADLIGGTNYLYASLPNFDTATEDRMSDFAINISTTTGNSTSDGSRSVPAGDGRWNNAYAYIRAANNVIEKSAGIPNSTMKTYCIAQARFFRALNYYNLLQAYGDVPLITRTITGKDDPQLYTPRTDRRIIADTIYADLDFAALNCMQPDVLPNKSSVSGVAGREYGRITRTAALALKSRVALYEGSFQKFHGAPELTGIKDPAKHFNIAKAAAQTIMNEGKHSLYTASGALSYQELFRYPGESYGSNRENILVRIYGQNITNSVASHGYLRNQLTDGLNSASRAYVTLALYSDGLPTGKSQLDPNGNETDLLSDTRNRDPRLVQTLFKVGDPYASISGPVTYPNTFYYHQQKYWTGPADFIANATYLDYIAIRYAEVLLNYAEATYELNESISNEDLNLSINLLRNRATANDVSKLPLLTNGFVTANGLNMRDEIRRERSIELAFEGFRYWDLLRWKTAEIELPKPMLARKFFSNVNYAGAVTPPLLNGYVLYQAASNRRFDPSKDYLWPLPSAQIGLSNNTLKQNPNWQP